MAYPCDDHRTCLALFQSVKEKSSNILSLVEDTDIGPEKRELVEKIRRLMGDLEELLKTAELIGEPHESNNPQHKLFIAAVQMLIEANDIMGRMATMLVECK